MRKGRNFKGLIGRTMSLLLVTSLMAPNTAPLVAYGAEAIKNRPRYVSFARPSALTLNELGISDGLGSSGGSDSDGGTGGSSSEGSSTGKGGGSEGSGTESGGGSEGSGTESGGGSEGGSTESGGPMSILWTQKVESLC